MKQLYKISVCAGLLLCTTPLLAEDNTQSNMATETTSTNAATNLSIAQIVENLKTQGYCVIKKIKFNDGIYEVKAVSPQGKDVKMEIDASGKMVKPENVKQNLLGISDAIKKIEESGYRNVYQIEASGDTYEAYALDKNGKKVTVTIDSNTNQVTEK